VDTSAGGADEAGILGGYRGTDGRVYVTDDRSGVMTEVQWARTAWLLALDTQADDLVWEQNLAGPTMRRSLEAAWRRIVAAGPHPGVPQPPSRTRSPAA
jgi:phage terminase large subunit-like protein